MHGSHQLFVRGRLVSNIFHYWAAAHILGQALDSPLSLSESSQALQVGSIHLSEDLPDLTFGGLVS
jgi:hypothetical protein